MFTLRPRDDKILRDLLRPARTRSRDVTRGDGISRLAGGPGGSSKRTGWSVRLGSVAC